MHRVRFADTTDAESYMCLGWYDYGINKLLANLDDIENIFKDRKFLSMNDIIERIVHVDPGPCRGFNVVLNNFRGLMKEIETLIKQGKLTEISTILPTLNSETIYRLSDNIHNPAVINEFVRIVKEDLYTYYISPYSPDANFETPIQPTFTEDTYVTSKITDKDELKELIEKTRPHINMLEEYHSKVVDMLDNIIPILNNVVYG